MTDAGRPMADVCLVLEGTYPYVAGGVSIWAHDLIKAQAHLRFHLVTLVPPGPEGPLRFTLPANVVGMTRVELQTLPPGAPHASWSRALMRDLEEPLVRLTSGGTADDLTRVVSLLAPHRAEAGRQILLNSADAWALLVRMYERQCPHVSFLEYFWTWRTLFFGLYSVLLAPLVPARIYHALCTGYAGLYAARAKLETGRPALLTEHGIYTNERRIEIAMADWLQEDLVPSLSIDKMHRDLRDLWIDTFTSYSRTCYAASSRIITLYEGNQTLQTQDGADPSRLLVIPNGIALADTVSTVAGERPPTIALVGRVVPIKDVKTFIRACAGLRERVPELRAWVLGPVEEDPDYVEECRQLTAHLGLEGTLEFKGKVALHEYFPQMDVVVLTSISEAQPLVILEGAAVGIPTVATDVGACREMLLGRSDEDPPLGAGGAITPLANPVATARELFRLLTDREYYAACGAAAQERVRRYYDKATLDRAYRELYEAHMAPLADAA
ncbi:MAG: GT4 family glycosyltransferase PelF [Vicinamibacterales bacterium]